MRQLTPETSPFTHALIGAALAVHKEFGPGFLEAVYQEALSKELARQGILHEREVAIAVQYKGEVLDAFYRADFVADEVLLELKAISSLGRVEEAQLLHYLKATGLRTGLLINFGSVSLQVRRLTNRMRGSEGLEVEASPVSP